MINSINPFELIRKPTAADSLDVNPVNRAAKKAPKNLPQNAQTMTQIAHAQIMPVLSNVRFVRNPE